MSVKKTTSVLAYFGFILKLVLDHKRIHLQPFYLLENRKIEKKIIAVAILGIFAISCSIIDDLLTFSIDNQITVALPSGLPVNTPLELVTSDIPSNSSTVFENNNTNTELVKDVKLKEMKMTVTNPADKSFSFLKSIHIYISTNDSDEI